MIDVNEMLMLMLLHKNEWVWDTYFRFPIILSWSHWRGCQSLDQEGILGLNDCNQMSDGILSQIRVLRSESQKQRMVQRKSSHISLLKDTLLSRFRLIKVSQHDKNMQNKTFEIRSILQVHINS